MKQKTKTKLIKTIITIYVCGVVWFLTSTLLDIALAKMVLFALDPVKEWQTADINVPRKATTTAMNIIKGMVREITAYNSVESQTDGSPCIGAGGEICTRYQKGECIVASNAYPLGTKLKINKVGICTVADRMNSRYQNRIDIFMDKDIERARAFGVQRLEVVKL